MYRTGKSHACCRDIFLSLYVMKQIARHVRVEWLKICEMSSDKCVIQDFNCSFTVSNSLQYSDFILVPVTLDGQCGRGKIVKSLKEYT